MFEYKFWKIAEIVDRLSKRKVELAEKIAEYLVKENVARAMKLAEELKGVEARLKEIDQLTLLSKIDLNF